MRKPLIGARISKLSLDKGNKLKGSWRLTKRRVVSFLCVGGVEGKVMEIREWCCVLQVMVVKPLDFWLINCLSQIHRWICFKIRSVVVWKV